MPNESNNNSNNRTDLIDLAWMDEYDAGLKGALASIVQDYMGRLQQCVQQATGMGLSHNDLTDQLLTKLQGLQNYDDTAVRALISGIRSDLAGYYTKLETYSQAEVNQMISLIPKFGIVVIGAGESLPLTVEDQEDAGYNPEDIEVPQSDKLYLVGDANAQSPNMYTEYIYVEEDDDYEMLGTQRLDLSGYSTTAQMNQAIANAIASMPTMSDTAITSSTIGQKQFFVGEKVNGKYVLQPFSPADLKQMVYDYMASNNVASSFASVLGAFDPPVYGPIYELSQDQAFRYYINHNWAGGQCFVMGAVCYGNADITTFSIILGESYIPSVNHLVFGSYTGTGPNNSTRRYIYLYLEPDDRYGNIHRIYIYMIKNASYRGISSYYGYDIVDKSLLPT